MIYSSRLPDIDFSQIQLLAFDKDETITPANKPLEGFVAQEIQRLTQTKSIIILTARDIEICKKHILQIMEQFEYDKKKIIFACCNGSQIYEYDALENNYFLKSELGGNIESQEFFDNIVKKISQEFHLPNMYFERRSEAMGTFVCIERNVDEYARKNFDPTKEYRKKIIQKIQEFLPKNYEIIAGGSTSIDVSIYNKESGMRHVMQHFGYPECGDIVFFGDNFDGGNDAPIENISDIYCVKVKNPEDTKRLLEQIS